MTAKPTEAARLTDSAPPAPPPVLGHSSSDLRRMYLLIAVGLFVVSLGQPGVIGQLPFLFLFKNQFHLNAAEQANLFAIATFAWYIKPLAGLVCDGLPLFGTRRRSYLILSSTLASVIWLLFAVAPRTYGSFFGLLVLLNTAMVFASTTIGGILVEAGQEGGATGRLASVRYAIDMIISVITGPLGGWLAARSFGWTAGIGACLMATLVPLTPVLVKEDRVRHAERAVWSVAGAQLRLIARSQSMWWASAMLFLVFVAPGFGIALRYYQQDTLNFSTQLIGRLQALGGVAGIVATILYAMACKKIPLKALLLGGILLNAASSVLYLWYRTPGSAMVIDSANGFLGILGILPLFDLAARATPKGSESFGYALLMSVYNIAVFAVSNPVGSWLYELQQVGWHHNLSRLVWLNTGTSLLALVLLPLLPKAAFVSANPA